MRDDLRRGGVGGGRSWGTDLVCGDAICPPLPCCWSITSPMLPVSNERRRGRGDSVGETQAGLLVKLAYGVGAPCFSCNARLLTPLHTHGAETSGR